MIVSRGRLTTTSYAILGLLAIKPWTTYELAQQMDRSLRRVWPRAKSKVYEEPKKLVALGLARASEDAVGRRRRTVYRITPRGRRALAQWLRAPGEGPVLEFEQLLQVHFAENGTKRDVLATLAATRQWAVDQNAGSLEVGKTYLAGEGLFEHRSAQNSLGGRFLTNYYAMVKDWAEWATVIVEAWPDDPRDAQPDPEVLAETMRRAERIADASVQPAG
jgi:DNA-binding PadR family transcriptional regulator